MKKKKRKKENEKVRSRRWAEIPEEMMEGEKINARRERE